MITISDALILLCLTLGHIISIFLLQPELWVEGEETNKFSSKDLWLHSLIAAAIPFLLLRIIGITSFETLLVIFILHFSIVLIKIFFENKIENHRILIFILEQTLYVAVILILFLCLSSNKPLYYFHYFSDSKHLYRYLIVLSSIFFLTKPAGIIIALLTKKFRDDLETRLGLEKAGTWIGILERLLIFAFVMTNNLQNIGFLIAAKSVFRLSEYKENIKFSEYVIIGTLLSFTIAIMIGLFSKHLLFFYAYF